MKKLAIEMNESNKKRRDKERQKEGRKEDGDGGWLANQLVECESKKTKKKMYNDYYTLFLYGNGTPNNKGSKVANRTHYLVFSFL